jgi:hypothetical protein
VAPQHMAARAWSTDADAAFSHSWNGRPLPESGRLHPRQVSCQKSIICASEGFIVSRWLSDRRFLNPPLRNKNQTTDLGQEEPRASDEEQGIHAWRVLVGNRVHRLMIGQYGDRCADGLSGCPWPLCSMEINDRPPDTLGPRMVGTSGLHRAM